MARSIDLRLTLLLCLLQHSLGSSAACSNGFTSSGICKPSIAIVTLALRRYHAERHLRPILPCHDFAWASMSNKYKYCSLHNYTLVPVLWADQSRHEPPVWLKIPALQAALAKHDWVWALDLDAFIVNTSLTIEDHIFSKVQNKNASLLISIDKRGINAGSFFLRQSQWTTEFLKTVWALRDDPTYPEADVFLEQAAMSHVIRKLGAENEAANVEYMNQRLFNSYPPNAGGGLAYERGDMVMHAAGYSMLQKHQLFREQFPELFTGEKRRKRASMKILR